MTGPVMVALDGSERDGRALAVAAALADLSRAGLHLVRVVDAPSARVSAQAELLGVDKAAVGGRRDAETRLAETAERLAADTEHHVTWDVLEGKQVSDELIRRATDRDARVVVMATRAPGTVGLAVVGSVAGRYPTAPRQAGTRPGGPPSRSGSAQPRPASARGG